MQFNIICFCHRFLSSVSVRQAVSLRQSAAKIRFFFLTAKRFTRKLSLAPRAPSEMQVEGGGQLTVASSVVALLILDDDLLLLMSRKLLRLGLVHECAQQPFA